jgi:hypothetical protein
VRVPVTQAIALIAQPGEALPDLPEPAAGAATPVPAQTSAAVAARAAPSALIRAMPAARRLAAERGLDLGRLVGSGPQGTITREDVEHALGVGMARPVPPVQKVGFYSDGIRLDGRLYTPDGLPVGQRRAAVVLLAGYTYLKSFALPDIAKALNAAGYVALVFDYRGLATAMARAGDSCPPNRWPTRAPRSHSWPISPTSTPDGLLSWA